MMESKRHSRDLEKDLSRDVHRAEWKVKEQKLEDDIKTLREQLLLLVSPPQTTENKPRLPPASLPASACPPGSREVFSRPPALLHVGAVSAGFGDEPPPPASAQHRGRPEERLRTQPAGGPAGPGHEETPGKEPGKTEGQADGQVESRPATGPVLIDAKLTR